MKKHILYFGLALFTTVASAATTNDFQLVCTPHGTNQVWCVMRNVSTNTIRYCDYSIGNWSAIEVEYLAEDGTNWVTADWLPFRFTLSAGPFPRNTRHVAPGAVIPPSGGWREDAPNKGTYTFTLFLNRLTLPPSPLCLRITHRIADVDPRRTCLWQLVIPAEPVWIVPEQFSAPYSPTRAFFKRAGW